MALYYSHHDHPLIYLGTTISSSSSSLAPTKPKKPCPPSSLTLNPMIRTFAAESLPSARPTRTSSIPPRRVEQCWSCWRSTCHGPGSRVCAQPISFAATCFPMVRPALVRSPRLTGQAETSPPNQMAWIQARTRPLELAGKQTQTQLIMSDLLGTCLTEAKHPNLTPLSRGHSRSHRCSDRKFQQRSDAQLQCSTRLLRLCNLVAVGGDRIRKRPELHGNLKTARGI